MKERLSEHKPGKIIILVQIAVSIIFLVFLYRSSLFETYIFLTALLTVFVFAGVFGTLQFFDRRGLRLLGIVLSIITSLALVAGSYCLYRIDSTVTAVSGADTQTVQMVVLVPADDPAETLEDASDYIFGFQNTTDRDNTKNMKQAVQSGIGGYEKQEYDSVIDMAQALIDEEIGAMILNSAFLDLIDDAIEDFSDQVKVVYSQVYTFAAADESDAGSDDSVYNILISVVDTGGEIDRVSCSDVNIILTVNTNTKKILLTTTPGDYYIEIPEITQGGRDKLAYAGIYGVETTMEALGNLYDIEIDSYIRVNFTALADVVDALGGVTVHSDLAFTSGGYTFAEGDNDLDGEAALAFSRERYAFSDGGSQRGRNQGYVLTGILEKMASVSALRNVDDLLDTMPDFVQTNMDKEQLMGLIGEQMVSQSEWTFEQQTATGTGDSRATYSGGSQKLDVLWPDTEIAEAIAGYIQLVSEGN